MRYKTIANIVLLLVALFASLPSSVLALPPPLSDELLALIDTANVYFDFHAKNSLQPATWLAAPSGSTTAGLILIDGPEMAMDFGHTTRNDFTQDDATHHTSHHTDSNPSFLRHYRVGVCTLLFVSLFPFSLL